MGADALRRPLRFTKMHGAGNDFVVLDLRDGRAAPDPDLCRALADRHMGVGCDQILTIEYAPAARTRSRAIASATPTARTRPAMGNGALHRRVAGA